MAGSWYWSSDMQARWNLDTPVSIGSEIVYWFSEGDVGVKGENLVQEFFWSVKVREPKILAIMDDEVAMELFLLDPIGKDHPVQLTSTGGSIYDYEPSPDGNRIAYTVVNKNDGIDIWMMNRNGQEQKLLLNCGQDRCFTPAWSPDGLEIAYTREKVGPVPGEGFGAPRIWVIFVSTKKTNPVFEDNQQIGYFPNYSPDGNWMSIWDGASGGILVKNKNTGDSYLLESSGGNPGSWSNDSKFLYFTNILTGDNIYKNIVYSVNINKGVYSPLSVENLNFSLENPVSNPVNNTIAIRVQKDIQDPKKGLSTYDPMKKTLSTVVEETGGFPGFYSFNSEGNKLLFQLDKIEDSNSQVEIWIWDSKENKKSLIAKKFRFPKWMD
jgi:hypothetical protein